MPAAPTQPGYRLWRWFVRFVHDLDVLVLATGFDARAYVRPMEVVGENGLRLDEAWADGPRAYRSEASRWFPSPRTRRLLKHPERRDFDARTG